MRQPLPADAGPNGEGETYTYTPAPCRQDRQDLIPDQRAPPDIHQAGIHRREVLRADAYRPRGCPEERTDPVYTDPTAR